MKVSIIILTKNGQKYITSCISKVIAQKFSYDFEVIVIDSGSTDKTLDLIKGYPLKLHKIAAGDFSHSRTRNLAVTLAAGEYIVYLSQDAVPTDSNWLEHLVEPLIKDESVAAVFGRQVPNPGTNPVNSFRLQWIYGRKKLIKHKDSDLEFSRESFNFSDVNAVISKCLLTRFPFDESLNFCEDVYLAKQLITSGYKIAYCPDAAVYHGHNHSLLEVFRRYFDIAVAYRKIGILEDTKKIENEGAKYILEELKYFLKNGYWLWIAYAAVNNFAKYLGFKMGCAEGYLPLILKKRISKYWYKNVKKI